MAYFIAKLKWSEPKPKTDQMKKVSKNFLVYAESVTECEIKMQNFTPASYQDPVVEEVKKTPISELKMDGDAESFWIVKSMDDADGTSEKFTPYFTVMNAFNISELIASIKKDTFMNSMETVEIKKFSGIVDAELCEIPKPKE